MTILPPLPTNDDASTVPISPKFDHKFHIPSAMNPDRQHPPYCMPKLPLASFSNEFKCDKCFRSRLPIQSGTTFPKSFSQCRISNVTLNEGYFMAIQAKNQLSWWAVHACTNPSLEIISHLMHFSFPQSLLCLLIKKKKNEKCIS